jgi:hypothetical protein
LKITQSNAEEGKVPGEVKGIFPNLEPFHGGGPGGGEGGEFRDHRADAHPQKENDNQPADKQYYFSFSLLGLLPSKQQEK